MGRHDDRAGARPFSIRLTAAERAALEARAGSRPLGEFVRMTLLGDAAGARGHGRRAVVEGVEVLAQLLALLGRSGIAANLSSLARQAEIGTLILDDPAARRLRQACEAVLATRLLILHALGKKGTQEAENAQAVFGDAFGRSGGEP